MNNPNCPICLDTIKDKDKYKTNCHHLFHEKCIERWFRRSHQCPLCRKSKLNMSVKEYEDHYWKKSNEMTIKIKQCSDPLFKFSTPPRKSVPEPRTTKRYRCQICKKLHITQYRYGIMGRDWEVFHQCTRKGSAKWKDVNPRLLASSRVESSAETIAPTPINFAWFNRDPEAGEDYV